MVYFAKMDFKKYLLPVLEFLMALAVMEIFIAIGIIGGMGGLVSTAISMYLIIMLLMVIIMLGQSGKVFLGDLRNAQFYPECKKNGLTSVKILLDMTVLYALILGVMIALYVGLMSLDIMWIRSAFPEIHADIEKIISEVIPPNNSFSLVMASILDYFVMTIAFVALVYFCVTMAYNIFTKTRYCGILAGFFAMVFGYFMVRVTLIVVKVEDRIQYHLYCALLLAGFAILFLAVTHASVRKHQWKD